MSLSPITSNPPHATDGARLVRAKDELRSALAPARAAGRSIGLVPTMGSLHEGHLSLLRAARAECDVVVMSLFVNPTQFGPGEDLDRYPRDEERDAAARRRGRRRPRLRAVRSRRSTRRASPPRSRSTGLTEVLDGDPARRGPEHFRGVTTVVAKLFNTVQPDVAYFGQKDAQQLAVIRRMVRDLDIPVRIEVLPTVREADGLAMSSRNAYLDAEDRRAGRRALAGAARRRGSAPGEESLRGRPRGRPRPSWRAAGIEPEYLEARDAETLHPVAELNGRPVLVAVAARVGGARLIDNVLIQP